ncbi:cobalamin biosynthesis protein [Nocardia uniformis]|uniref:Cobalamin biosynthesis protein n=1 Tax=Nocardia uniformis TaxID=53432 RepID=A0A849C2K6_9NOCA|nr:cobalamin biosynthesis protein [Nocardia uniformis]NNH72894.1 cobalamin biosynthesis protein [Nocardia uniformis]
MSAGGAGGVAVGVGMRPGAESAGVLAAVRIVVGEMAIGCLATVDRRAGEPGLIAAAAELGVPIVAFTAEQLAAAVVPNPSFRTAEAIGTASVAEAAALLAAGTDRLAVDKCVVGGITVAAAVIEG